MYEAVVYTDGACLGNPGPGGWGVRIVYADNTVCELGGMEPDTTNNRMELQAAIAALQVVQTRAQVMLYTDSRYVIDGRTKWLPGWRRRGWITATNTPVKNRDLWITLEQLSHTGIHWRHVYGHRGHPQNERVDSIARAYAAGHPQPLFCGPVGAPDDPVSLPAVVTPVLEATGTVVPRGTHFPGGGVRYVSLVRGVVALDRDWPTCAARVQGVSGARYRKVRTPDELAAFCAAHGVAYPGGTTSPPSYE
jgi:ribonuclease HI